MHVEGQAPSPRSNNAIGVGIESLVATEPFCVVVLPSTVVFEGSDSLLVVFEVVFVLGIVVLPAEVF